MGDIYKGGYVTLAALAAVHSDVGLFTSRDPLLYYPCPLVALPQGGQAHIVPPYSDWKKTGRPWPLHTRGWAVQKRILSRRTLGFGPMLSWMCPELAKDELKPSPRHLGLRSTATSELSLDLNESAPKGVTRASEYYRKCSLPLWKEIVIEYAKCSLTGPLDRWIAISGLASAISLRTGLENHGGMWLPITFHQLLWMTEKEGVTEPFPTPRPRTELRPSWSWISVQSAISFVKEPLVGYSPIKGYAQVTLPT